MEDLDYTDTIGMAWVVHGCIENGAWIEGAYSTSTTYFGAHIG